MDLLNERIRPVYLKYLASSFGSALIVSVYSMVDMAMVGQYEGPNGAAALAVVAPVWNLIYSLGLLTGTGGSVIYSIIKGKSVKSDGIENEYFTVAVIGSVLLALAAWMLLIFFETPLFTFFGADGNLLPLAGEYVKPIKAVLPLFLMNQMLSSFLRNDNNPALATAATLAGGLFNIFGDYFFVFACDMGVFGAGLATAMGCCITFIVTLTHFCSKKNSLKLKKPTMAFGRFREITVTGFSAFFVDVAMGILTILFNRQIMKYLGSDALAVYGPIVNVSTLAQCCAYSIGNAAQPILSVNFGAGKWERIKETMRYAVFTAFIFGVIWTAVSLICPNLYVYIFMKPTEAILLIAPGIIRKYGLSFIFLPFNILSTYYFQSVMKSKAAFWVSVLRGLIISGALIMLLPVIAGGDAIWFAMPVTELIIAFMAGYMILKYIKELSKERV